MKRAITILAGVIILASCATKKEVPYFQVILKEGKFVAIVRDMPHICSDTTHATCDGECTCDGMECNN